MKVRYNSELLSGGLFLLIGLVLWFLIPGQVETMETGKITAQTFPRIAVGGMVLCSLGLLVQGFRHPKKTAVWNHEWIRQESVRKELRSVLFCGFLLLYCLLFQTLGFIVDTLLLVAAILVYYKSRKPLQYLIAFAAVLIVYVVFTYGLNVNLPTMAIGG